MMNTKKIAVLSVSLAVLVVVYVLQSTLFSPPRLPAPTTTSQAMLRQTLAQKKVPKEAPPEYTSYITPETARPSLSVPVDLPTLYDADEVRGQPVGPYRTTVTLRNVEDLKRLQPLVMSILAATQDTAVVLANRYQLEQLAVEQFRPKDTDLVERLTLTDGEKLHVSPTVEQLLASTEIDADQDGLSDIEEGWWCTDPGHPNTDRDPDGYTDGVEIDTLLDVTVSRQIRHGYGLPFGPPGDWPAFNENPPAPGTRCNDGDEDTIPNFAESLVLGTDPGSETTDHDKYDDGQEFFGRTFCRSGGGHCNYGIYPRPIDNYMTNQLPGWILPPGDSPFVASFPLPEIGVIPGSWEMEKVTTITTQRGVMTETQRTYQTTLTRGQGTSVANSTNWNDWEEVSEAISRPLGGAASIDEPDVVPLIGIAMLGVRLLGPRIIASTVVRSAARQVGRSIVKTVTSKAFKKGARKVLGKVGGFGLDVAANALGTILGSRFTGSENKDAIDHTVNNIGYLDQSTNYFSQQNALGIQFNENYNYQNGGGAGDAVQYALGQQNALLAQGLQDVAYAISQPRITETRSNGRSWGGSQTNTTEEYEEHAIGNSEGFTTGENWSTAWAENSSHAANLRFQFTVGNDGTDMATEVEGLIFNIYIGDEDSPSITYRAWEHFPGGILRNLQPGQMLTLSSNNVPLTLDQMRRIDEGNELTILVESYSYGDDQVFYQDAQSDGVTIMIEDGIHDGDEDVDTYIMPIIGPYDTVQRVLLRFFPGGTDEEGYINSLWTPEFSGLQPPTWNEHYLSDSSWWNVYTTVRDTRELKDLPASPESALLFRFNRDSDRDGYSDRAELYADPVTDEFDPLDHPQPEVLAGYVVTQTGNTVTVTLAVENQGTFDAYGIDAVMYAPNDTITVTNNTIGGNGIVKPGGHVALGSLVTPPDFTSWPSSAPKAYVMGNYLGGNDREYTFTVSSAGAVGQGGTALSWTDGVGGSGIVDLGANYQSPLPRDVAHGLKIGVNTGNLVTGWSFTVEAFTPRDTFTYRINSFPYTKPVIVVSYSDPQGTHRFITPVGLPSLDTPLSPTYSGQMLGGGELQAYATSDLSLSGTNLTNFVYNNPLTDTIQNAHLYVNFVISGTVVAKLPYTVTLPPGPSIIPVSWSTSVFTQTYTPEAESLMLAFLTDHQGTVIDGATRPLYSLAEDPKPTLHLPETTWNFGSASQGTLLSRALPIANTGHVDMIAYIDLLPGLTISPTGELLLGPADAQNYTLNLSTEALPVGPYSQTVAIRTSDPASPTRTLQIQGTITSGVADTPPGAVARPLDWSVFVPGSHSQNEWITYTHTLGSNTSSLHPVKVFSENYTNLWGVGKYATAFGGGNTFSYSMFGDGRDGPMPSSGNLDNNFGFGLGAVNGGQNSTSVSVVDHHGVWRINPGDYVLIHQTQGSGAGKWELNRAASDFTGNGTFTLANALSNVYITDGGANRAQIMRVPQYTGCGVSGTATPLMPWNGAVGGIFAVMCRDQATITGTIDASGRGYRMGPRGDHSGDETAANGMDGEGYPRASARIINNNRPNGNGGGPGDYYPSGVQAACNNGGGGGGGGGNGSSGGRGGNIPNGGNSGGLEGGMAGNPELTNAVFGGGGGGGSGGGGGDCGTYGFDGANGGGIVFLFGRSINVTGSILSNGNEGSGRNSGNAWDEGAGGSGAGGSILLKGADVSIVPNSVRALGGPTVIKSNGAPNIGGAGGVGRIRIEYCNTFSGSTSYTNPTASPQQLNCYIAEQIEAPPYNTARLNLPEAFTNGRTYNVQYGGRLLFTTAGELTTTLRISPTAYITSTLNALISDVGVTTRTLRLDIGDNNSWDWEWTGNITNSIPLTSSDLAPVINSYWAARGAPTSGNMDVPIRVYLSNGGQVLLTNIQAQPTGSKLRHVRLSAQSYATATLSLAFPDVGAGPVTVAADVGADGSIEWASSTSITYPTQLQTGNLGVSISAYMSGRSGEVDVPVRFLISPNLSLRLAGIQATPTNRPDPTFNTTDIAFSDTLPTEGQPVTVTATLRNPGNQDSGGLTAAFSAEVPGVGPYYIGSVFVPNIPPSSTVQTSFRWDTMGFTGDLPVRAEIDPYDAILEGSEQNNVVTSTLYIRTRPDLRPHQVLPTPTDSVAGEPISATIIVSNTGETTSATSITGWDVLGERGDRVTANLSTGVVPAASTLTLSTVFTPTMFGLHTITVTADLSNTVLEPVETNNVLTRTLFVGLKPDEIDAGAASDLAYTLNRGYGATNGALLDFGGNTITSTYRFNGAGPVEYRFDGLQSTRHYHLDAILYQEGEGFFTQTIKLNGLDSGVVVPMQDGVVGTTSILVPSAAYASSVLTVSIGSLVRNEGYVSWLKLTPIEYTYLDAGSPNVGEDPAYALELGHGYLGSTFTGTIGGIISPPYTYRSTVSNTISYRFDNLKPEKRYAVNATMFDGLGSSRVQSVRIDGSGVVGCTGIAMRDTPQYLKCSVGSSTYVGDRSIIVTVSCDNCIRPKINEVALEELTGTTPAASKLLVGHVTWQGRPGQPSSLQQLPATLTLKQGTIEVEYPNITTDVSGYFTATVSTVPNGHYSWRVKGPQHLANAGTLLLTDAPTTQAEMGIMKAGDVNGDNTVDITDFSLLRASFGKSQGEPGYDARADFSGDNTVDITDFSLLRGNFGASGAPPLQPTNLQQDTSTKPSTQAGTAYLELRPQGSAPANGGSVKVGERFVLELWLHPGKEQNLVGQQSYLNFSNTALQNVQATSEGCEPLTSLAPDLSVFDIVLQNEVCNSPEGCVFRGVKVAPGSISFASGAMSQQTVKGAFRVGEIALCAVARGQAKISWQLDAANPEGRGTKLVDDNGKQLGDVKHFADFTINVDDGQR